MNRNRLIYLSLISGLLFSLGWFEWSSGLFLLIAFIPLLIIEEYFDKLKTSNGPMKATNYAALAFFTWNILTTWWIYNASVAGMFVAVLVNTLLFSLVFFMFHYTKRKLGPGIGYLGLIFYWVYFEYFYLNAEITWPWLNLGNAFANNIKLIQWYEYTGILGGTFWILLTNILLFRFARTVIENKPSREKVAQGIISVLIILIPIIFSLIRFHNYSEKKDPYNIVVVQPNIDPYEKFVALPVDYQLNKLLTLSEMLTDSTTHYIVAPETAINNDIWLETMELNPSIRNIRRFMENYPQSHMVLGITSYKSYPSEREKSHTARELGNTGYFYDSFNSAIQIDSSGKIPVYHKSLLVVGVEKMPYPQYLGFLRKLTLRLGGTFRSHGVQDYRGVFFSPQDSLGIAPVICWESVFGEYVTDYIKNGAGLIFVITNDGWWGDTPGYRQHHAFSRLRAIETRRSIARSANTGTSSFINQKGEVFQATPYWEDAVIKQTLNANHKLTFYTLHGDYLGRTSGFFALLIMLYVLVNRLMVKRKPKG